MTEAKQLDFLDCDKKSHIRGERSRLVMVGVADRNE